MKDFNYGKEYWWRRRELNPRPEIVQVKLLQA